MKGKASLQSDLLLIPVIDNIHNSQFIPSNGRIVSPTEYFFFFSECGRNGNCDCEGLVSLPLLSVNLQKKAPRLPPETLNSTMRQIRVPPLFVSGQVGRGGNLNSPHLGTVLP